MAQHELRLDPTLPAARGLAGAFADMVAFIRAQVTLAPTDPVQAVHDYRRSLRRARAQIALTAPFLHPRVFAWVDGALKRAFQETSALRDHGVLLPTLDVVAPAITDPAATEAIRGLLEAARDHVEGGHAAEVLARRERWLAGLEPLYAAMIDAEVDADALRGALAASYAFTRRAFRQVYATRRDADLHAWRKAVKGLRYQLELLVNGGFDDLVSAQVAAAEQTRLLGDVTDVMALVGFVRESKAELRAAGVKAKGVRRELERVIRARTYELLELGAPFYMTRPRRFGRPPGVEGPAEGAVEDAESRAETSDGPEAAGDAPPAGDQPVAAAAQDRTGETGEMPPAVEAGGRATEEPKTGEPPVAAAGKRARRARGAKREEAPGLFGDAEAATAAGGGAPTPEADTPKDAAKRGPRAPGKGAAKADPEA